MPDNQNSSAIDASLRREVVTVRYTNTKPAPAMLNGVEFNLGPWIESLVDEAMLDRALAAYNADFAGGQRAWMRAALISAMKGIDNG